MSVGGINECKVEFTYWSCELCEEMGRKEGIKRGEGVREGI